MDNLNRSPLFEALSSRNLDICTILRQHNAQLVCQPDDLMDLLLSYVRNKEDDMFQLVHSLGLTDFNSLTNVDDKNIGHFAVQDNSRAIVQFLSSSTSFDFTVKDRWNQSCLDIA